MRKIIQIFHNDGDPCALCNDGTTWWWSERLKRWDRWLDDIPQVADAADEIASFEAAP